DPLRRGPAVDEVLVVVDRLQHLVAVVALVEDWLAAIVNEFAALAPEIGEPVEGRSLPAGAIEDVALLRAFLNSVERSRLEVGPGRRRGWDQGLVAPQPAEVGAPPPRVYVPVRSGDARPNEWEKIGYFLFAKILVDRLQHLVLHEEAELERIDGHAVRRAAGAGLFQQSGVLAADISREEL